MSTPAKGGGDGGRAERQPMSCSILHPPPHPPGPPAVRHGRGESGGVWGARLARLVLRVRCFLAEEASVGQVRPFLGAPGAGDSRMRGRSGPFHLGPSWVSRLQVQHPLARKLLFLPLPPTRRPKVLFPSALGVLTLSVTPSWQLGFSLSFPPPPSGISLRLPRPRSPIYFHSGGAGHWGYQEIL